MKHPRTRVTDRAVLRYLERVQGINVELVRRTIGHRVDHAVDLGASGLTLDGINYKIEGGVVVTVLIANRPDIRTGRKRRGRARP